MADKRIKDLTNTATESDLVSGNYLALDGSAGTKKLNSTTLLTKTAQNALAGNVAPAFDENKPNDANGVAYYAREFVVYGGALYQFVKNKPTGAWDAVFVKAATNEEVFLSKYDFSRKVEKETVAARQYSSTSARLDIKFSPNVSTFKMKVVANTYGASGYSIYFIDSTGTNPQITYKTNVSFDAVEEITLTSGYDTLFIFSGTYSTGVLDVDVIFINDDSTDAKLESVSNNVLGINDIAGAQKYTSNHRLDLSIYPTESEFVLKVEKTTFGRDTYDIFLIDSTGTNPQITFATNVYFGAEINVTMPTGYDRLLIYNSYSSGLVDVTAYYVRTDYVAYRINNLEEQFASPNKLVASLKSLSSVRLDIKIDVQGTDYLMNVKKNAYSKDVYSIFLVDTTGVNPQITYKSNVAFGYNILVHLPSGYNRIFIYNGEYYTGIDVEVYFVDTSLLEYRLGSCEQDLVFKGKNIVCFGDSITEFTYNGMGYIEWLAEYTKANIVRAGIGGTRYAIRTDVVTTPTSSTEAYAALDVYNLVHSWVNNSFTAVDNAVTYLKNNESDDNSAQVADLKASPISDVDIVTLFAGTNDWAGGTSKGAVNNNDPKTLLGAVSMIIEELLAAKPSLKIFVFTPTVRWIDYTGMAISNPDNFSDVKTSSGRTLKELAGWIAEGVQSLHIPVCDFYNALGWNQYNFGAYFLDTDGTHPYKGFDSIAKRMYGFMVSNNW